MLFEISNSFVYFGGKRVSYIQNYIQFDVSQFFAEPSTLVVLAFL